MSVYDSLSAKTTVLNILVNKYEETSIPEEQDHDSYYNLVKNLRSLQESQMN